MHKELGDNKNGKIVLDRQDLKALSSDIRIEILKKLDSGSKTLRKLSNELNLPKSTVHENLTVLVKSGFIEKRNEGSKWAHYVLTKKGKSVLHPHEKVKIILLISFGILSCTGGIIGVYQFMQRIHYNVKGEIFHPEYLILYIILVAAGTVLLYSGLRKGSVKITKKMRH